MKIYCESIFENDIIDIIKLFFPNDVFRTVSNATNSDLAIMVKPAVDADVYICRFKGQTILKRLIKDRRWSKIELKRYSKRTVKLCVYEALIKIERRVMPWGALTGVRPTKLARELVEAQPETARETFRDEFLVSEEKTNLTFKTLEMQEGFIKRSSSIADLYIHIPFCTTRCSYCSFVTGDLRANAKLVEPYIQALKKEVSHAIQLAKRHKIRLENVYVGGGTPTSISVGQLNEVLSLIDFKPVEFSVECGRPDSMSEEHMMMLKRHHVDRISINPQTFIERTLELIERKHTISEIVNCFFLARAIGFSINMDLIAGLPGETVEDFVFSLNKTVELYPENITIHSLALKAGSKMKTSSVVEGNDVVAGMLKQSTAILAENGYNPYYLYRQKYVAGNFENTGFCLNGEQCKYNIGMMEETKNIIACGASAISKKVFNKENRLERCANLKDIESYTNRIDEMIAAKEAFFEDVHR